MACISVWVSFDPLSGLVMMVNILLLRAMMVLQCLFTLTWTVDVAIGLIGKLLVRAMATLRLVTVIAKTALVVVPTTCS